MKENKRIIGTQYEEKAVAYLQEEGYEILERNYSCRLGEIDIIGRQGGYLCFIEVKYRRSETLGGPFAAVNQKKQKKICAVSVYYMMRNKILDIVPCRYDVVGITPYHVEVLKNAFSYS